MTHVPRRFVQVETSPDPVLGVEGYVATAPREGALVILVGLLASRVLTSTLAHFPPGTPSRSTPLSPPTEPHPLLWLFAAAAPVLVGCGCFVSNFVARSYKIGYHFGKGVPELVVDSAYDRYTAWDAIDGCRTASRSAGRTVRGVVASVVLGCSVVVALLQAATLPVAVYAAAVASGRGERARPGFGVALHFLSEWASLDMLCVAVFMMHSEFPSISESFSRDFGYDADNEIGPKLVLELHFKAGLWLSFSGAVLATVVSQVVLKKHFAHAFSARETSALAWEKTVVFAASSRPEEKEADSDDDGDEFHDLIYDEWRPRDLVDGEFAFDDDQLRAVVAALRTMDDERDSDERDSDDLADDDAEAAWHYDV